MALINSSSFGSLAEVSVSINNVKIPTKFFNVSISGKRRGKMNQGYLQCPVNFNDGGSGEFFILNADNVYFLPLYIKKYWAKYTKATGKDGSTYDQIVEFGWKENLEKPQGAKTEYIIAGILLNPDTKEVVKHTKDIEDNNIKAGDPVLIYFRCKGTKCNCAYEYVKRVNEAAKNLNPLSDNPVFEQSTINPRRFMIRTSITQKESSYGPVDVFDFNIEKELSVELVQKLLNWAQNTYMKDFDDQFDKSGYVKNVANKSESTDTDSHVSTPIKQDEIVVPDVGDTSPNPGDDFNIDI